MFPKSVCGFHKNMHAKEQASCAQRYAAAISSKGKKKGRLWRKAALGVAKPGFAGGSLLCGGKAGESILVGREVDGLEILDTVLSDVVPNHPIALFLQLIHVDIG